MLAVLGAGLLAGCGGPPAGAREPIPSFAPGQVPAAAGSRPTRATVLPTDCQDVISGAEMSALLGKPVDSVQPHTVLGIASASVGRLERVSCQYRLAGVKTGLPALEVNLSAYATSSASDRQLSTNAAAEQVFAQRSEDFGIGTARAVLCTEHGQSVLLVSSGRVALTMSMQDGVTTVDQTKTIMVDLAQRVLPRLGPMPAGSTR
jgi:hypothetical protein